MLAIISKLTYPIILGIDYASTGCIALIGWEFLQDVSKTLKELFNSNVHFDWKEFSI